MRIGKHKECRKEWTFGYDVIEETVKYNYLGDVISSNGRNKENLSARNTKLQGTTITINKIAANEVINQIETANYRGQQLLSTQLLQMRLSTR